MKTFAEQVIEFYSSLRFKGKLPKDIEILNPYLDNDQVPRITEEFYTKFYQDHNKRSLILGINPGRLGAGATGIPFTDTKRLWDKCGIRTSEMHTHEPSSVFVYDMIDAFGGVEMFYNRFYISSVCPLGFVTVKNGKELNFNYYDNKSLETSVAPFAVETISAQIQFGLNTTVCYCLGTGKNFQFLSKLNQKQKFFEKIVPLEHPRYVMQYKSKMKQEYITKYLEVFTRNNIL